MIERRKVERFELSLQASVAICGGEQTKAPSFLTTKDISMNGAYFMTTDPLPVGTKVDVDLILRLGDGSAAADRKAWIKTSGSVQRTDPGGMVIRFDEDSKILPFSAEVSSSKR